MPAPAAVDADNRGPRRKMTGAADDAVRPVNAGPLRHLQTLTQLPRELLLGRLRYRCLCGGFALPFYGLTLPGMAIQSPLATPPDPWPGNAERGSALIAGTFRFAGQTLQEPEPTWAPAGAGHAWLAEMHSFSWLRDLRAAGGDAARRRARALVSDWLDRHDGWSSEAWAPLTLSRRLSHWLGQYDFFASSAELMFRQRLLAAATRQAAHLSRCLPAGYVGADLICAIKGLAIAGASLPDGGRWLQRALRLLRRELPRQILADGGHVERSPARHLAVLRDLIDIKSMLHAAGIDCPHELQVAIEAMAPMLRLFLHGDGALALFNGSSEEDAVRIEMVLQRADGRGRPRQQAPQSGFHRLQAGRTLLLVDCGAPLPPGLDRRAHAGTLSFEMSVGRERLIVNCGAPGQEGEPAEWRRALRATAAHSTLAVAERNSSLLAAPGRGEGLLERAAVVHARREEAEGNLLLELAHDGYRGGHGLIHHRRLYLGAGGDDLRGEDRLSRLGGGGTADRDYAIRFHLHPEVQAGLVQDGTAVLLRLPKGGGWRLRAAGAVLDLAESVYFGSGSLRRSQQIVLSGRFTGDTTRIKWALQRESGPRGRRP